MFYAIAGTIFLTLLLTAYVAIVLKKDDAGAGGWLARLVQVAQLLATALFSVFWASVLDYLAAM